MRYFVAYLIKFNYYTFLINIRKLKTCNKLKDSIKKSALAIFQRHSRKLITLRRV